MMIMMVNGDDYDEGDDNDDGDDDDVGKSALRQWVLARAGGGDRKTKIGGPAISFSTHPLPPSPPTWKKNCETAQDVQADMLRGW